MSETVAYLHVLNTIISRSDYSELSKHSVYPGCIFILKEKQNQPAVCTVGRPLIWTFWERHARHHHSK